uniref:Uncharacterized protein n=1 Tax=Rhizophora mucronata TaxID=61149 RepID=A0A2P2N7Y7_RHIMU
MTGYGPKGICSVVNRRNLLFLFLLSNSQLM